MNDITSKLIDLNFLSFQRNLTYNTRESDCAIAVGMVKDSLDGAQSKTTVRRIKDIVRHFEGFKIHEVKRKRNMVANFLTKSCETNENTLRIMETPNDHIMKLLQDDLTAVSII